MNEVDKARLKKKSWVVDQLPWIGRGTCQAVYPNIYLSRKVYDSIISDSPDPYAVSVVLHEQEHLARMKQYGVLKWGLRYLVSPRFRFEEEVAATRPQFAHIKSLGLMLNIERKAKNLSGWLYLWPTSYPNAMKRLKKLWQSV